MKRTADISPMVLEQAAQLDAGQPLPVVLSFESGDGVRLATRALRALGFVAYAASPSEVAGELPAGAVTRLATVPGLAAVQPSVRHRPPTRR